MRGLRFSNEVRGYSEQAVEVIAQPGRVAWDIYDEARERPILGFCRLRGDPLARWRHSQGCELAQTGRAARDSVGRSGAHRRRSESSERRKGDDRWIAASRYAAVAGSVLRSESHRCSVPYPGRAGDRCRARVLRPIARRCPSSLAVVRRAGFRGRQLGLFSGGGLLTATTLGRIAGASAGRLVAGGDT
jgi:fumarate reductase flavoprotein subunit